MRNKNPNPPAFPVVGRGIDEPWRGMSLRDYYAGQFAPSIFTAMYSAKLMSGPETSRITKLAAEATYVFADALLKARAKYD